MNKELDKKVTDYINNKLVFKRFNDLDDLKNKLDYFFYDCIIEDTGEHLKVLDIAYKSYYDNDFQDYEIMATIGTDNENYYDITIYYAKTRINNNIIVETSYEKL